MSLVAECLAYWFLFGGAVASAFAVWKPTGSPIQLRAIESWRWCFLLAALFIEAAK